MFINGRTLARKGAMTHDAAKYLRPGEENDFYQQKDGDKVSGKCVSKDSSRVVMFNPGTKKNETFRLVSDAEAEKMLSASSEGVEVLVSNLLEGVLTEGEIRKFWVVTKPTPHSVLIDICFESTPAGIVQQAHGGLTPHEVVGFYANESEAKAAAEKLLKSRG